MRCDWGGSFAPMKEISIDAVLSEIVEYASNGNRSFTLSFVRSSGKKRGSIKIAEYRYGAPDGHVRKEKAVRTVQGDSYGERGGAYRGTRKIQLHIENHTIPLTNVATNGYESPRISRIIKFNKLKVNH